MANQYDLPGKLLLVDDDRSVFELIEAKMRQYGVIVDYTNNFDSALYLFNTKKYEICFIELELDDMSAGVMIQKFRQITKGDRHLCGFAVTHGNNAKPADLKLVQELGNIELLPKPLTIPKIINGLSQAAKRGRKLKRVDETRVEALEMYNEDKNMQRAFGLVDEKLPDDKISQTVVKCEILEETEQFETGLKLVEELIRVEPENISYVNKKARFLMRLGRIEEAGRFFEIADKISPKKIDRVSELAAIYLEQQDPDKTVGKMEELIALNPELSSLKFDLFRDLNTAGFQEYAVKLCKNTTSPREVVTYYNNKGVVDSQSGNLDEALQEYYMALIVYPTFRENYKIQYNIALAEAKRNTSEGLARAITALESCLKLQPEYEKAINLKAKLEKAAADLATKASA